METNKPNIKPWEKYYYSKKGQATKKAYTQSQRGKESRKKAVRKYINSEHGKATRKAYVQGERGKEKIRAARKVRYVRNKGKIKIRGRIWRMNHREIVKKRKREWARSPNGRLSRRTYWKKSPLAMFRLYERVAKRKNLTFDILFEDFNKLIFLPCVYCGYKPTPPERNGLDRIDNTKGYELSNTDPCCHPCNQMKGKLSVSNFICKCKEIIRHMEKK